MVFWYKRARAWREGIPSLGGPTRSVCQWRKSLVADLELNTKSKVRSEFFPLAAEWEWWLSNSQTCPQLRCGCSSLQTAEALRCLIGVLSEVLPRTVAPGHTPNLSVRSSLIIPLFQPSPFYTHVPLSCSTHIHAGCFVHIWSKLVSLCADSLYNLKIHKSDSHTTTSKQTTQSCTLLTNTDVISVLPVFNCSVQHVYP